MQLISAKPAVYLVNLTEKAYVKKKNKWLPKIHEWVQAHGGEPIIPFSGKFEAKLVDMPEDEREAYCKEVSLSTLSSHMCLPDRIPLSSTSANQSLVW